jgi:TonB dependent receptor/TonB-dependent Receptor Plug Domain/Secretin and TonB N terminus short domain
MSTAALRLLALTVAAIAIVSIARAQDTGRPEPVKEFSIPAQPLSKALLEFSKQADIIVTVPTDLVQGKTAPEVRGDLTPAAALAKLLQGSGLQAFRTTSGAITIGNPTTMRAGQTPDNLRLAQGSPAGVSSPPAALSSSASPQISQGAAGAQPNADVASAQTRGDDASTANTNTLDEVVVTGTAMSGGVKKLDASFSITTASLEEIRTANPSSAADLLKIVPGLWAESSGGETGANIELAGFPGGGDAPYVTYQLNGSPVFPVPTLSFMENSSLFRIDESIERAEVVQGGPAVVFSNGQIGATANFILRQGGPTPHGDIGLTVGSEGLYRLDGFFGGPISEDWFVSLGGFYRNSNGIRKSQFPADDGGQLTGTLSHKMENGSVLFYARVLNDKNLFITDVPLSVSADGKTVSAFPGFSPGSGTFAGNAIRGITVQEFPGAPPGTVTADLADGRGSNIHMFGNDLDLDVGEWKLSNKLGYTGGHMPTNALFNNLSPQTLDSFAAGQIATVNKGIADPTSALFGAGAAVTGYTATWASGPNAGKPIDPATEIASLGFWIVDKKIQSFTDDLRFSRELFAGNSITVGGYFASYSSDDVWYLGNNMLVTATPNAQLINVKLNNGGPGFQLTQNGLLSGTFFALVDHYSGKNAAAFVSDQWRIGPWLFDAGVRIENQRVNGTVEGTSSLDLDSNPLTLYNNGTSVANGTFTPSTYNHTLPSWSVGANYEITSRMSAYGRINQGYHFPGFDDLRSGTPQSQEVKNYEVGYRVQTSAIYAGVGAFIRRFYGVPFQQFLADGSQITASYGAQAYGTTFEASWLPIDHLTLSLSGDWQHGTYTGFTSAAGGGGGAFNNTGNILQRQPKIQFRFTPEYDLPVPWGEMRVFATWTHVGLRYSDIGNTQPLPQYNTLDAGIVTELGTNFEVRVQGSNLTNEIGLTEGNARVTTSGIVNGLEMARPIFGPEVNLQLRYKF